MNAELRQKILADIDRRHDLQVAFLAELVRVPSDNPPGDCAPHAARAASLLRALGFTVECHEVPKDLVATQGMVSVTNLIIRHRFGPGPVIALNAHGDVVPPGAGWTVDPYGAEIRDGVMYGRGVAVSKSDFATYAFALKAIEACDAPLRGTVELHFTYDEEAGGLLGPHWLLTNRLSTPDYAICAGFAHNIVVAHNGCLHLKVRIEGRSAHAARPESGHDALEAATRLLAALYAARDGYSTIRSAVPGITHPTLVVGLIEGGINTNVVPDLVTLRLDRRIIPEENPDLVERDLRALIEQSCTGPGIRLELRRILFARPFTPQAGQERLVQLLQKYGREMLGENLSATVFPFTPMRAITALRACRPCFTARARARSLKPTVTAPMSALCSRICVSRRGPSP